MEEADLLKERLQAITDKRRIQEDIAKKRRQIEEEKLKLQYIKKKALREQWLMDGLSQQSEEEQEAMRLQAQDEQQQSDQLQSNILRIEKEVETLEAQELSISANEEAVLKRLKEVERTAEDIIKEINAEFSADASHLQPSTLPDIVIPPAPTQSRAAHQPARDEPKKATFAVEISVEHDKRTGKSQVVSTAAIAPETIEQRGLKVYEDGRKSVYALHTDGAKTQNGSVGELTLTEVEELLRQATDEKVPTGVQYHQPVYATPYTGTSRPSTPRTPTKTPRQTPTPSISARNGTQILKDQEEQNSPNPRLIHKDSPPRGQRSGEEVKLLSAHIPGHSGSDNHPAQRQLDAKTQELANMGTSSTNQASLVSIKARSEQMPAPLQPVYRAVDSRSPSVASHRSDPDTLLESSGDFSRYSPFYAENNTSLNLVNTLPEELESEPVTMIFMGYENAEDDEEEDIQAELVVIADSDEENEREEFLSYHPEGYRSRVFQPKVGLAQVTRCRDIIDDAYTNWEDYGLHKPTFIHKPGKHSPYLQGPAVDEPADNISMGKMKLCSTGR
ncbi:palmdelphin-like [Parambassis ranga]|uniref:Palmdelphin n=1 Tax=Parambassis ranga TaxID=210632 RepID=A0A6P7KH28_9TELE|nr:palmdelphin [Parambassis ranga]